MKNSMIYLAAGLAALFLQTTVFPHLSIKADLVLVLVVYLGLFHTPAAGAVLAFLLGCIMDVFAGSTLGFFALSKTSVFFFVCSMRGHLYFESHLAKAGLVLVAALIEAAIFFLLVRFTSYSPTVPSSLGRLIIGPVLLTALVAPFCFVLFKRTRILVS